MQRRKAIRQIVLTAGALAFLPSCGHHSGEDGDIAALCATLIPSGKNPGAKEISAHLFVRRMVDDCYNQEEQARFVRGLAALDKNARRQFDKAFADCSSTGREAMLHQLEEGRTADKDLDFFYSTVKKLTIQAYTTSEWFLTKVHVYQLVPGHYYGCVPVAAT